MITINLLPQELRIKETKKIYIPYRQIAFVVFLFFLLVALYNLFIYIKIRQEHRKLDKQWKSIEEKNTQAEELEKELGATILAEIDFYDAFVDRPLGVSRILNLISDLAPDGIWFDQLKFEGNKDGLRLSLTGYSGSHGKDSKLVEIQKFTTDLKNQMEKAAAPANPNLKRSIKVTVATSSQKTDARQDEVVRFTANFKSEDLSKK